MSVTFGLRSEVRYTPPTRSGLGDSRRWRREINGQLYSFTVVRMPNGDVRLIVSKFNGYCGGPSWGCAWDLHRWYTLKEQS